MRYGIITPVRNEVKIIKNTLESVVKQNLKPEVWVIVDDGSTDGTFEILKEYEKNYNWIKVVKKGNRGHYKLGSGVVDSFNIGLNELEIKDLNYIVKLDGDLGFEPDYFNNLLSHFDLNPKLGIVSGLTYFISKKSGKLIKENAPLFHAIGASKIYRKECFIDIGGLISSLGWDSVDIIKARHKGWSTRNFPNEKLIHYRPMSSKTGILRGRFRNGLTDYITGTHPLFILVRGLYRMIHYPYFIGGILIIVGYFYGMFKKIPQIVSTEEKRYFQKEQLKRIIGKKINV